MWSSTVCHLFHMSQASPMSLMSQSHFVWILKFEGIPDYNIPMSLLKSDPYIQKLDRLVGKNVVVRSQFNMIIIWILFFINIHYITLRYVTLRYVTLRYVTLRNVTLRYVTLRYVTLR